MSAQPDKEASFLYEVAPLETTNKKCIDFMLADLAKSGLTPADIACYPTKPQGFGQVAAYVIKFQSKSMWTIKLDQAKPKYLGPKGMSDIWIPHQLTAQMLAQATELYIIEGEKKAAKFFKQFGLPTIGIRGCSGYGTKRFTQNGDTILLKSLVDILRPQMQVIVVFDADIKTNANVQLAAQRLDALLEPHYVGLKVMKPPHEKGVDDWLVEHPTGKVTDLIEVDMSEIDMSVNALYKAANCIMKLDKDGLPKGPKIMEENASRLLEYRYADRLFQDAYNGFIFDDNIVENPDRLNFQILRQFQKDTHEEWPPRVVYPSVLNYLYDKQSNMLLDAIMALTWDGVPRLNTWASDYIEADNPKRYIQEWGRLLMTSIMLRITQPGCQCDRLFGLTGRQGINKTTFFKQLSLMNGKEYYYNLNKQQGTHDIEIAEGMKASFIVDMDEGIFLARNSAEAVKTMISSTESVYRVLYTSGLARIKRGNIFVTTNNKAETLVDTTGSRRFMLLRATKITYLPYEEKLQILAEAIATRAEIIKSPWYVVDPAAKADDLSALSELELAMTTEEYQNRHHAVEDTMSDWLERFIASPADMAKVAKTGIPFVSSAYLLAKVPTIYSLTTTKYIGNRLVDLANNPNLAYKLTKYRCAKTALAFKDDNMQSLYTNNISNAQDQLNGYLITPR